MRASDGRVVDGERERVQVLEGRRRSRASGALFAAPPRRPSPSQPPSAFHPNAKQAADQSRRERDTGTPLAAAPSLVALRQRNLCNGRTLPPCSAADNLNRSTLLPSSFRYGYTRGWDSGIGHATSGPTRRRPPAKSGSLSGRTTGNSRLARPSNANTGVSSPVSSVPRTSQQH